MNRQDLQTQAQQQRVSQTQVQIQNLIEDVLSRDEEIRQIEHDIRELNELFKDVHTLVRDQTIVIDNIEKNVESAVYSTDQGVIELAKAKENQSSCVIS